MFKWLSVLEDWGLKAEKNVSGAALTTFKSGGAVKLVLSPYGGEELVRLTEFLIEIGQKYKLLGGGSNVLIADGGLNYPLIKLTALCRAEVRGSYLYAEAGARLPRLSRLAAERGLTGMEFCCGIPATLGGALACNAGAYGGEIGNLVQYVEVAEDGGIKRLERKELAFGYRGSSLHGRVITGALLNLDYGDPAEIEARVEENMRRRKASQPAMPSAGSTFKRVDDVSPAVYIERLGLKGLRVGGAVISEAHANFIVNAGGATTNDYLKLAELAAERVYENYSIKLTKEVLLFE